MSWTRAANARCTLFAALISFEDGPTDEGGKECAGDEGEMRLMRVWHCRKFCMTSKVENRQVGILAPVVKHEVREIIDTYACDISGHYFYLAFLRRPVSKAGKDVLSM